MFCVEGPASLSGGSTTISLGLGRLDFGLASGGVLVRSEGFGMPRPFARALKGSAIDGGDSMIFGLRLGTSFVLTLRGSGIMGLVEDAFRLFDLASRSVCDRTPMCISGCVGATGTVALLSRLWLPVRRRLLCPSWTSKWLELGASGGLLRSSDWLVVLGVLE